MIFCEANSHFFKIYLLTFKRKVTPRLDLWISVKTKGRRRGRLGRKIKV